MGIGTSSSSSGASAPRANAYAVNRDASELGRSPAQKAPASTQPGPMHVIYMYVRAGSCVPNSTDSRVRARTALQNRRQEPSAAEYTDAGETTLAMDLTSYRAA